ncbi:MAG: N-acetyl-gamma-glutamyl-phosphate reductase [Anaerolineales bacterium]|nr:N-acetyl-gamma-glutamyl-phosphate reductase [Anaerolineales bacterium]
MIRVGIYGASGYTGVELVKLFARHPQVRIAFATSDSYVGKKMSDAFLCHFDIPFVAHDAAPLDAIDVAFLALPHGASADYAKRVLDAGARVIDLSADFRLHDAAAYKKWYGLDHHAPELLPDAVYGMPELHRARIKNAKLIANPGCYPTSVILGLAPIWRAGATDATIIVDSKSGVSGAGRKPTLTVHFCEVNENLAPYNIGRVHRHLSEMEQELQAINAHASLIFSPHLLPVTRGILSTMYVRLNDRWDENRLRDLYVETYRAEPFVKILPSGQIATLAHSVNTNFCTISIHYVADVQQAIICASIDNLIKGASGQAVQNMNVMFGLEETTGLI